MTTVLITGATGNVGREVIKSLHAMEHHLEIYAGVRNPAEDSKTLAPYNIECALFDFSNVEACRAALASCDILFLLRPPNISDVAKYFTPIIELCKVIGVKHIVFLSVQGVEKSRIIPHHKIEQLIVESQIPYTFLRPAYFMQNFTTTLRSDLVEKRRIFVPAGKAKFTLIDVRDVGSVAASVLTNITGHVNASYDLTCFDKLTFAEMATVLSSNLNVDIQFISPGLIRFFLEKRQEQIPTMLILVMIMLHYFPRFQKEPEIKDWVERITHRPPITFKQFILDNASLLKT